MTDKPAAIPAAERGVTEAQRASLLAKMDITMRQKLAFVSAHFRLHDGARILDIGCGSGKGSHDLALLNPRLQVVGLDYDQGYIDKARATYRLPNLSFVQGDARTLDLGGQQFDAILNSSLMHEIYSFNGYSQRAVDESLQAQLRALKPGGVILLRDFMRPPQTDAMVYMDLPPADKASNEPSYAERLRRYSRIANSENDEEARGFFCEHVATLPDGWERFYLAHDWAWEFIWRKEYTVRFEREAHEKYGVWRAEQYRDIPEGMGARVLYQAPYYNPWIAKNWHDGKVRLYDAAMKPLPPPPSNYVALIQKIGEGESLSLREHRQAEELPSYLRVDHFSAGDDARYYDVVSRPGEVMDVLPYVRRADGSVAVFAKSGYPRPIVNSQPRQMSPNLDGKAWSGHMVEPLAIANQDRPAPSAVRALLAERTALGAEAIESIESALSYYTAAADVNERVSSVFVRLTDAPYEGELKGHFSGFSGDGSVRAFEIQDLLRSVQVGMLPEARLEMNIYALMRRLGIVPEGWIGDDYRPATLPVGGAGPARAPLVFTPVPGPARYLLTLRSIFVEEGRQQDSRRVIAARPFEFVVPGRQWGHDVSTNGVAIVPLVRDSRTGEMMIGIRDWDFPSVQTREGQSRLVSLPGFRLPSSVKALHDVKAHIAAQTGYEEAGLSRLGESYFPSMGIMPNRIYPYVATGAAVAADKSLRFVPLRDVFRNLESYHDAQLIIGALRAVHALGLWAEYSRDPAPTAAAPQAG